jgi:hypothetical protein
VRVDSIGRAIDLLVYLSVVLGLVLLLQIYVLVPAWLFYSVLAGWFAYLVVAVIVATGRRSAYPLVLLLSVLTLLVSLPEPEHYSFAVEAMWLAASTFAIGSALQVAIIVLIPIYLIRKRKSSS